MRQATVFLDFETTGMSAGRDRVTDIGLVRIEADGSRSEWMQLVDPGMHIPSHITALTGISDAMVAGAPEFEAVAGELCSRLEGALIVAHNATFDMGFLYAGLASAGMSGQFPYVCSVRVARRLFPDMKSRSLDAMMSRFGVRIDGMRHRAFPDAEALSRIWDAMRDASGPELFDRTVAPLVKPAAKPATGTRAVTAVPPADASFASSWPYPGVVVMSSTRRAGEWHVFRDWRHLGTVVDETEIALVATRKGVFCEKTRRRIAVALATPGVVIRPL